MRHRRDTKNAERCNWLVDFGIPGTAYASTSRTGSLPKSLIGTGRLPNDALEGLVRRHFDFTPAGIIKYLNLRRPIFKKTAAYGHFGRNDPDFTWERTDRVKDLRDDARV